MAKFETEKDVKRKVKQMLEKNGWFWWMPAANGYGKSGVADFNALKHGTFLAIETKFGSRKPTALQVGYLNSIQAEMGMGFVVNENRLDTLEAWLQAFDRATTEVTKGEKPADADGALLLNAAQIMTQELV